MVLRPPASEAGAYTGSATSAREPPERLVVLTRQAAGAATWSVAAGGAPRDGPRAARPWPGAARPWDARRPARGGDASPPPLSSKGARDALVSESAASEVGDQLRRRRVEADDVEHPRVVRVSDREAVRDHADHDQPCVDSRRMAVVAERLGRVNVSRPGLRVGVDDERVDLPLERLR